MSETPAEMKRRLFDEAGWNPSKRAAERFAAYRIRRGHAGNPTPTEVRAAAEIELLDLYDPAAPSHRLDLIRALTSNERFAS